MSILHRARRDVQEADDALVLETLDAFLKNSTVDVTAIDEQLAA